MTDEEIAINDAITLLRSKGYSVTLPAVAAGPRVETPGHFCRRLGISHAHFSRRLDEPECPGPERVKYGPTGRILALVAGKEFEDYMRPRPGGRPSTLWALCGAATGGRAG